MFIEQESRTAPQALVQANTGQNTAVKDSTAVEAEHREGKKNSEHKDRSSCLYVMKVEKHPNMYEGLQFQILYLMGHSTREVDLLCQQTVRAAEGFSLLCLFGRTCS